MNRLLTAEGCVSNNGTKSTPALSADLFGDWREEVMWRTADTKFLRIYSTTIPAVNRIDALMHDPQYRLAIAWQNVGYNLSECNELPLLPIAPNQSRDRQGAISFGTFRRHR